MLINEEIVKAAAGFVKDYISKNLNKKFSYHNLDHTRDVVAAVEMISEALEVDKRHKRILLVAAWFHDIGYTHQTENHESVGASIAESFLVDEDIDPSDIAIVKSCILATHYPQKPANLLEGILCDADMSHLGSKSFWDKSILLRKEWEETKSQTYSDEAWVELNISFVSAHQFHTFYCTENLEKKKQKNIVWLKDRLYKIQKESGGGLETKANHGKKGKSKKEEDKLERGVETLFRSASSNHMKLSGMADNKAHILLSINSIIISIILSVLAKKLVDATFLIIPTILLLAVSVASIVFAVLTTQPKISKGVFTIDQINNREVNLLFFGNFHQMDLDTYQWGIREMMYDKEYLYKSMTKDIYFMGKVLAAKYRFLNIGYKVFMYGLMVSILAYTISFLMASHGGHH